MKRAESFPLAENFTSARRGRDDRGWRLRLQEHILLAPKSGYVVLKVTDGGVPSRFARHLTSDAAVDRALPPLTQADQMAGIGGGLSRPRQRLGDVRQSLPSTELVTAAAFRGDTSATPFAQNVGQLSEARSPTALVRRRAILSLVRWRDRCDLRRRVSPACS